MPFSKSLCAEAEAGSPGDLIFRSHVEIPGIDIG